MDNLTAPPIIRSADPAWLRRLNFDVLFAVISWLDPLSILQLSCSCKTFHTAIASNYLIWKKALHDIATAYCVAPHSFDGLSVDGLKRFSTRPSRLIDAFSNPERPIRASARKYVLNPGVFMTSTSTHTPHIQHLRPKLLPGGRWILSGIILDKVSVHLFCWDRSQSHPETEPLSPIAAFSWDGIKPLFGWGGWIQAQMEGVGSVILACSLLSLDQYHSHHEVLRLSWNDRGELPVIELVARLECGPPFTHANSQLHGNYIIINTERRILLWNWKDRLDCELDLEGYEWAGDHGFILTAIPPCLFVMPRQGTQIFVIEIPRLHPLGSIGPHKPIRSSHVYSHQIFPASPEFLHQHVYAFDLWKPLPLRGGMAMTQSIPLGPFTDLFHLTSLHPTDAPLPTLSPSTHVNTLPLNLDLSYPDCLTMAEGVGIILLTLPEDDPEECLRVSLHYFTENGGLENAINRKFQISYTGEIDPTSLDLVSGTAIVTNKEADNASYTRIVQVVSFD
ncbi:hypothetical protein DL93DRAFT_2167106 [Clavulina sp. PMI_390]|nr:hypothetical protein DL93DRAFT_2167106 [Clavulina sp. PMI_390]